MLRSALRVAVKAQLNHSANATCIASQQLHQQFWSLRSRDYSSKGSKKKGGGGSGKSSAKSPSSDTKRGKVAHQSDAKDNITTNPDNETRILEENILAELAEDEKDKSLDVGYNGRPLFTYTPSLSQLTRKDTCSYMKFDIKELNASLPEGLPSGMLKEFEASRRTALLVRQSFLDLRNNLSRIVDPPLQDDKGQKIQKRIVLDGPVNGGKSITLSLLVHWARDQGWLVFYVPEGRKWTHGGYFYKNPQTGLWDTPVQAADALQDFMKYNESKLEKIPCQISDPIPLGEGAGIGWMKGVDSITMPEGSTLYDLIQTGITNSHAAVGVIVRLRKELSLVKDIPVLIAIDQYNSWFTFSEFQEPVTVRSCRDIHARELTMVNAFRSMMHDDIMIGAFSHSTAVGKLRQDLPDVPIDARMNYPRYNVEEAAAVSHYYLRQRLVRREAFSEEGWKKVFYLSHGNGAEMRWLVPFMR
ncbi:28S ribosomal protein S29, mitochondrial [Impatiens glandulifera]|uniref:28S ribosomal protein S29, mitochondrial n=1 Tax=Impatiens glandulifera TaxID=253017 RepID=UPI001FB12A65|nr:28S ribosomal protein S29, mitochondrial [Impatiens glandulifera]XP_047342424.1 28S ribosomal protein S29, mitochondrial [Impatiens glandulifera]